MVAEKLKYVVDDRVSLYPMRTVQRLKLRPETAQLVQVNIWGAWGTRGDCVGT